MTLQQTVTLGNDALAVLENEAFKQAISRMHSEIVKQWENCPVRDKEGQTLILQMKKVAKLFEDNLHGLIRAGDFAQHKIDLESARENPRGKVGRYLRTVSR
jgi:hypothetical protein